MKEQLITFKTAKLAKKKGFNLKSTTNSYYSPEGILDGLWGDSGYYASTQSVLQKWLREEKNILIEVTFNNRLSRKLYEAAHKKPSLNFSWKIYTSIKDSEHIFNEFWSDGTFETYEEALEEGLQKALKIIG